MKGIKCSARTIIFHELIAIISILLGVVALRLLNAFTIIPLLPWIVIIATGIAVGTGFGIRHLARMSRVALSYIAIATLSFFGIVVILSSTARNFWLEAHKILDLGVIGLGFNLVAVAIAFLALLYSQRSQTKTEPPDKVKAVHADTDVTRLAIQVSKSDLRRAKEVIEQIIYSVEKQNTNDGNDTNETSTA